MSEEVIGALEKKRWEVKELLKRAKKDKSGDVVSELISASNEYYSMVVDAYRNNPDDPIIRDHFRKMLSLIHI